jgi:hypothetical protein
MKPLFKWQSFEAPTAPEDSQAIQRFRLRRQRKKALIEIAAIVTVALIIAACIAASMILSR